MLTDTTVSTAFPSVTVAPDPSVGLVLGVLEKMVASPEPAVVFSSAAALCAPLLCDIATVTIAGPEEQAYRISWPRVEAGAEDAFFEKCLSAERVPNSFTSIATGADDAFRGTFTMHFIDSTPLPEHALLGRLIVERAVAVVERERLSELVTAETTRANNLRSALASNREIGVAMGILMSTYKVTGEQAFDLLRRVSQHGHRKLREIAVDVTETGTLELPPGVTLAPAAPQRPVYDVSPAARMRPRPPTPCLIKTA